MSIGRRAFSLVVVAGVAAGAFLFARSARAQGGSVRPASYAPEAAASSTRLLPDERAARSFLRSVALTSQVESEASRIAIARGHSPGVRSFAIDLLESHQVAEPELLRLLHAREMAPPLMDVPQRKALQKLARLGGSKFDHVYIEMVAARQQSDDIGLHERTLAAIGDPVLKGWIERRLAALREQQVRAMRLAPMPRRAETVARR